MDNSITIKRIKNALSPKVVVIVLVIVAIASTIFYVTVKNKESKELLIWYVTNEDGSCFSDDEIKLINDYGVKNGIDKVVISKRSPLDDYFDVTMSTTAIYNCDIFIMNGEMAQKYAESIEFLSLDFDGAEDLLYYGERAIGILINENYYLLINKKTDIDLQKIYDIFEILTKN